MKKNFCVWALLCLFIFSACKSEGDAYQAAMSSDDIEVLYQFLEEYPDAPAEHRDSIACKIENQRYKGAMETNDIAVLEEYLSLFPDAPKDHYDNVLNKKEDLSIQNALYSTITDGVDIVASYQAAETYMSNHPEGIYATEVKAFIEKEAEAYKAELENRMKEQYEAKYGELIRNNLVNYKYEKRYDFFVFAAPDMNGEGYGMYNYGMGYQIFTYKINESNDLIISGGKTVKFFMHDELYAFYKSCTENPDHSMVKDGHKQFANGKYWYKEISEDSKIANGKVEFNNLFKGMNLSNKHDNFIWCKQLMHDADEYNKEMKLLEAAKSIYKKWK